MHVKQLQLVQFAVRHRLRSSNSPGCLVCMLTVCFDVPIFFMSMSSRSQIGQQQCNHCQTKPLPIKPLPIAADLCTNPCACDCSCTGKGCNMHVYATSWRLQPAVCQICHHSFIVKLDSPCVSCKHGMYLSMLFNQTQLQQASMRRCIKTRLRL